MKIRELRIGHFGKLHDVTIRLEDGINLIYGENESGKSTLYAFIGAMLFGLDRGRGRAGRDDPYSRYLPWDTPGAYQGSMDFEHEGTEYRITRVFYRKEKSCVLTEPATGKKIPLADDSITSLIPQLTRSAYYNTVGMGQMSLKSTGEFAGEVKNHIANLASTGESRVDVTGAQKLLDGRRKELASQQKALRTEELAARQKELQEKEALAEELSAKRAEQLAKAVPLRERIETLKRDMPDTTGLKEQWQAAGREADEALEALREAEREEAGAPEPVEPAGGTGNGSKRLVGRGLVLLAAGGILCILGNERSAILIGVGILLIMASIIVFAAAEIAERESRQQGKEKGGNGGAEGMDSTAVEENPRGTGPEADEGSTDGIADRSRAGTAGSRYREAGERLAECAKRFEAAVAERERIAAEADALDEQADAYESEAEKLEWELRSLGDTENELEAVSSALFAERRKEEALAAELEAVNRAAAAIEELSSELKASYGTSFNELLSEEIYLATDGRYSAGRVSDELGIEVMSGLDYVPAEALSAGTVQQLYVALRFASARLLFGDLKVPVLMDEVFAYSDEQRIRSGLSALADREGQQILLFTCRNDEERILNDLGVRYNLIGLPVNK